MPTSYFQPDRFLKSSPVEKEVPDICPWQEATPGIPIAFMEWCQQGSFKEVCPGKEPDCLEMEVDPEEAALNAKNEIEMLFADGEEKTQDTETRNSCSMRREAHPETAVEEALDVSDWQEGRFSDLLYSHILERMGMEGWKEGERFILKKLRAQY
ncbi:hypothetical protein NDU88_004245 [Pleurodeles waltl]|uniref:Uncharacterized protein n=1 Tax=Pleurodeles waltl TaxID=8319 RepID=A0AAV7RJ04_PLEWA|nr:hypothetical protein NDU88_004245 [Pleurodeles waltl]